MTIVHACAPLAAVLLMGACATPVASPTPAAPSAHCGVDLTAPQIISAIRTVPPYAGAGWSTDPSTFDGNYDPCATLSTALVTVDGATGSSPETALMFHDGAYLGTATSKAYGFTTLNRARTTDDTVVLDYATPGECNACAPVAVTGVRYHWDGGRVVMLDPPPAGS